MENNEMLNKEEIEKKLETAESMEEVISILNENGAETTEEELIDMMKKEEDGELSDESLEGVAGGVILPIFLRGLGIKAIKRLILLGKIKNIFGKLF